MSDPLSFAEQLAILQYENQRRLAPDHGYSSMVPWEGLTSNAKSYNIACMADLLETLGLLGLHVKKDGQSLVVVTASGETVRPLPKPKKENLPAKPAKILSLGNGTDPTGLGPPKISRAVAIAKGYMGDPCGNCQAFTLRRNGTCLICDTCGQTTGCS
jgi:hypothetical protein